MRTQIKLQPMPPADPAAVRPYPYWIDTKTGAVGRQEFWKGAPMRLVGFAVTYRPYEIAVELNRFVRHPDIVSGMHPVFEHLDGGWHTYQTPVQAEGTD